MSPKRTAEEIKTEMKEREAMRKRIAAKKAKGREGKAVVLDWKTALSTPSTFKRRHNITRAEPGTVMGKESVEKKSVETKKIETEGDKKKRKDKLRKMLRGR